MLDPQSRRAFYCATCHLQVRGKIAADIPASHERFILSIMTRVASYICNERRSGPARRHCHPERKGPQTLFSLAGVPSDRSSSLGWSLGVVSRRICGCFSFVLKVVAVMRSRRARELNPVQRFNFVGGSARERPQAISREVDASHRSPPADGRAWRALQRRAPPCESSPACQ